LLGAPALRGTLIASPLKRVLNGAMQHSLSR
jgi:hypothetical protein